MGRCKSTSREVHLAEEHPMWSKLVAKCFRSSRPRRPRLWFDCNAPVAAEVLECRRLLAGTALTNALVVSTVDSSVVGQQVVFTAAVAPALSTATYPTGTVTFNIDGVASAPVALQNGIASLAVSNLVAGSH